MAAHFCRRFIESVRLVAGVICVSFGEATATCVTACASMITARVVTVFTTVFVHRPV